MLVNVITRTHDRPLHFEMSRNTVTGQTHQDINHIVGTDIDCPYFPSAIRVKEPELFLGKIPNGHYFAPWNKYLEELALHCKEGLVMYLDDDDRFTCPDAIERILKYYQHDNQMLVWKVRIDLNMTVPSYSFAKEITAGDFSGIGFMFHTKHLPVKWSNISYGDFRVAHQLVNKGLEVVWINEILTTTISGANNGKKPTIK